MVAIEEERLPSRGLTDADRRRNDPGYGWYSTGSGSNGSNGNGHGNGNGNGHAHGNGNGHGRAAGLTYGANGNGNSQALGAPSVAGNGNGHTNGNGHAHGNGNGNGNGHANGTGNGNGNGHGAAPVSAGFGVIASRTAAGSTAATSSASYGRPLDLSGWQPVDESRRQPARSEASRPADVPAFHRVENGSPRYRGPDHSDPAYSPIAYHFDRVRAHEAPNPWKIWGGLFGLLGIAAMLLLVISLPALLRHSDVAASPSPTEYTVFATYPAGVMTTTPPPSATPVPTWASPTVAATFRTYVVKPGDNLSAIANKYHLKMWEVLAANPSLGGNPDTIQRGMTLYIPNPGQMKQ